MTGKHIFENCLIFSFPQPSENMAIDREFSEIRFLNKLYRRRAVLKIFRVITRMKRENVWIFENSRSMQ